MELYPAGSRPTRRAPGSKATRVEANRAGAAVAMIGSCHTVPVKYSFGARRVGREPARWISMVISLAVFAYFLEAA